MKNVIIRIPEGDLELIDILIEKGIYSNRSQVIKSFIKDGLKAEEYNLETRDIQVIRVNRTT